MYHTRSGHKRVHSTSASPFRTAKRARRLEPALQPVPSPLPHILVLSLSSTGSYLASPRLPNSCLLKDLLSRAVVHESLDCEDALQYIRTGWPSTILVTGAYITRVNKRRASKVMNAVHDFTFEGGTTIFMGNFSRELDIYLINHIFNGYFKCSWKISDIHRIDTNLGKPAPQLLRTHYLPKKMFIDNSFFLRNVPTEETIYSAESEGTIVYAAAAEVNDGILAYVGESDNPETDTLILALCGLDKPEDAPRVPRVQ